MSYTFYLAFRQILMGLLLFLGLNMLFSIQPKQLRKSFFQRSLRIMGIAFLLVPLSCFIYTEENQLDLTPYLSTAISLTAYFATFVLMAIAFLILLGRRFSKKSMAWYFSAAALYPLPLWASISSENHELINIVMAVSYTLFVIVVILLIVWILHNYRKAARNIDNYYSDDIHICVTWVSKSIKLLIGLSITCILAPVFFTYPLWLRFIFMSYGVLCYLHILYGYRRMFAHLMEQFVLQPQSISTFAEVEQSESTHITLNPEVSSSIESKLQLWLSKSLYLQQSITINSVAREIATNRTYLSKYINTTYDCSFKSWITQLRIEEAKRLLAKEVTLPINHIATTIGFASVESFTHVFTRIEGMPPSKWRSEHKQG